MIQSRNTDKIPEWNDSKQIDRPDSAIMKTGNQKDKTEKYLNDSKRIDRSDSAIMKTGYKLKKKTESRNT